MNQLKCDNFEVFILRRCNPIGNKYGYFTGFDVSAVSFAIYLN